ncbi:MAG: FtsQ-type POTRA domain-containing protein [Candidatus Eremiobacteraeota bacterium]|nr:FtsQ-type POTRA domain-containing protein [Candidatus Eremiobacteraeota bacterium]
MSRPEKVRRRTARQAALGQRAIVTVTIALVLTAVAAGLWREATDPRFAVGLVTVEGCQHTAVPDVVVAAAIPVGTNAWLIDRAAAARRVEALPWVHTARLHVRWPNQVTITVSERQPVALVALGQPARAPAIPAYALIDETQRVLTLDADPATSTALPVLVVVPPPAPVPPGAVIDRAEVGQALETYRRLVAMGLRISDVAIAPSTGISATADRNVRVLFGEDEDLAKKAELFQAIVAKISTPSRVAYIDVRSIRAPTVLYR